MKRNFLIFCLCSLTIFIFGISYDLQAQDNGVLAEKSEKSQLKDVYFTLVGVKDDTQFEAIKKIFDDHEFVQSGSLSMNQKCKVVVTNSVDVAFFNKLLAPQGASVMNDYIQVLDHSADGMKIKGTEATFPTFISTGDAKEDERKFALEVEKWREENPEAWQKRLENRRSNP